MSEYIHADVIRRLVDAAPPLSAEVRAKLAILLRGSTTSKKEGAEDAA